MFGFVPYFLPLLFSMTSCGKLVETGNGNYAITGKGCGITTELKYMSEIPRDHESYECVIIVNPTQPLIEVEKFPTCADSASFCSTARGDGYCDDNCNYADCNFDDGDCCGDDVETLVCIECLCKE